MPIAQHKELSFERATNKHLDFVLGIYAEAGTWLHDVKGISGQWAREVPNEEAQQWIDSGGLYVASLESEPIGIVRILRDGGKLWSDRPEAAIYVGGIAVSRRFAGRGLGLNILSWAEQIARDDQKPFLRLDGMAANSRLRQYYVDSGFESLGESSYNDWFARLEKKVLDL